MTYVLHAEAAAEKAKQMQGLWVMGYGLWVMGYGLWVMGYGLWVMGYGLWVMVSRYDQSLDSWISDAFGSGHTVRL
jgi:hypothetical protein